MESTKYYIDTKCIHFLSFPKISSAYPVPHSESEEEVAIDMKYEQSMYQLYKTINPADVVLGW